LGAQVANYVGVTGFLREECRIIGVKAVDKMSGNDIQVQAKVVVNAAGPWVDELLADLDGSISQSHFIPSTAINLVTRKIIPDFAAGITSQHTQIQKNGSIGQCSRVLFIAPWRDYSLVGTLHEPHNGNHNESWVTEQLVNSFIEEVNQAYPGAKLSRNDVFQIHHGFLPMIPDRSETAKVKLVREGKLIDHGKEEGIEGLITTVGVKYTTARHLAEKTVDMIFTKLKRPTPKCQTRFHPISGGNIHHFDSYVTKTRKHWPVEMPAFQIERLLHTYGTNHSQLLPYYLQGWYWMQPVFKESNVTRAELIHAVRGEMAHKLSDVILRRTEIGLVAKQSEACLIACAELVGAELAWSSKQVEQEIEEATDVFKFLHN
jgi:glycerol-3-phosphate dehydrogenase